MNILAACAGADSPVRKVIFKSSTHCYGCEQDDPAFFTEAMRRRHPPRTPLERDIVEAEEAVADFADEEPRHDGHACCAARTSSARTSRPRSRACSSCRMVPMVLGFDPRLQFVHEDDIVHALEHAALNDVPGVFNVAADGVLALSEVICLLGKRPLPILPPFGSGLLAGPLRRLGFRFPDEMHNLLRFGRGVDNRLLKATGFAYGFTSRETVLRLGEHQRLSR